MEMDPEEYGNLIESVFWSIFAVVFFVKARLVGRNQFRRLFVQLAAAFLAFGISDLVESRTGTWWDPVWLLIWKATCILIFFLGTREYYRMQKAMKTNPSPLEQVKATKAI